MSLLLADYSLEQCYRSCSDHGPEAAEEPGLYKYGRQEVQSLMRGRTGEDHQP